MNELMKMKVGSNLSLIQYYRCWWKDTEYLKSVLSLAKCFKHL